MSTLNYIDENGNINKAGVIPQGYPASNIVKANGVNLEEAGFKLLWTNPNPNALIGNDTQITISSGDYDILLIEVDVNNTYSNRQYFTEMATKGHSINLCRSFCGAGNNVIVGTRSMKYVSDTKFVVQNCYMQTQGSAYSADNNYLVPYKIYGIKI